MYGVNDIYPVKDATGTYIYAAIGAATDPEFDIAKVTTVPTGSTSPTISSTYCGTNNSNNGNSGWKLLSSLDFNSVSNTQEAANSVFAKSDGTRAYMTSNGGIDGNGDGIPDSKQFYILDTTNKSAPTFISGTPAGGGPTSGFYYGRHNLALTRPITASSNQGTAANAVDGSLGTNWLSTSNSSQNIYVDLGASYLIDHVKLNWGNNTYATSFKIQVSNDASAWTDIYSTTTGNGGVDDLPNLSGTGRYVRMIATARHSNSYGYSLNEFTVLGVPTGQTYYNDELFPKTSLTVLNGQRAVIVGRDGYPPPTNNLEPQEYQVLNLDTPESQIVDDKTYCGGLNFAAGFNGLTSVSEADGDNFVYMITNTNDHFLKIIQGGVDGTYMESGDYTSPPIDIGYTTIFKSYVASVSATPGVSAVSFQFAIASPSAGQDCSNTSYDFIGPNGGINDITDTYTATSEAFKFAFNGAYHNPGGRCFKYKSYLSTTDYNQTPALNSLQINYAP